ncbi:MAG: hypothetical protein PWP37_1150 [Thermotogota bacterium]|nr:hypothetical protein [Thermotogota bacterium]MDK2864958.1 hypothetical protein [Thermotogota bacterium]HCZ07006.1 hypothetical protein [Thermotogota bacterium]
MNLEISKGEMLVLADRGDLASGILKCAAELGSIEGLKVKSGKGVRKLYLKNPEDLNPKWNLEKIFKFFRRMGKLDEALFFHEISHLGVSMKTPLEELSDEMIAFLYGVLGMAMKIDLLILDSIIDTMGSAFKERFLPLIKEKKESASGFFVSSTNPFSLLKLCDRLVIFKGRKVLFNGPIDLLSNFRQISLPTDVKGLERFRLFSINRTHLGINALVADEPTIHALKVELGENINVQDIPVEEVVKRLLV